MVTQVPDTSFDAGLRKQFEIQYKIDPKTYLPVTGTFVIRRPNFIDQTQISRNRTAIIGANVDENDLGWNIAQIMAIINVCAEVKPHDFDWKDVYDFGPWLKFIREYYDWIDTFRPAGNGGAAGDSGTGED